MRNWLTAAWSHEMHSYCCMFISGGVGASKFGFKRKHVHAGCVCVSACTHWRTLSPSKVCRWYCMHVWMKCWETWKYFTFPRWSRHENSENVMPEPHKIWIVFENAEFQISAGNSQLPTIPQFLELTGWKWWRWENEYFLFWACNNKKMKSL